jgi:hypothetical protein
MGDRDDDPACSRLRLPWRLWPRRTNFSRLHGERPDSVSMAGEIAALRKARSNTGAPKLTKSQEVLAMFAQSTEVSRGYETRSGA